MERCVRKRYPPSTHDQSSLSRPQRRQRTQILPPLSKGNDNVKSFRCKIKVGRKWLSSPLEATLETKAYDLISNRLIQGNDTNNSPNVIIPDPVVSNAAKSSSPLPDMHSSLSNVAVPDSEYSAKIENDFKSKSKSFRPTPQECHYVTQALSTLHSPHVLQLSPKTTKSKTPVTDAVISTMLTQNTTEANSRAAFSCLLSTFRNDYDAIATCPDLTTIEKAIRIAGLAKTRAERIRCLLRTIRSERGVASFEYLHSLSDTQVKTELLRFKGMGPKTVSCVLLFALHRNEFPVDTHVLRISKRMGWVPSSATRESAYEHLNRFVPNECKFRLHCLLVAHGKVCHRCCASIGRPQFPPPNGEKLVCPLVKVGTDNCPSRSFCYFKKEEDDRN